MAQTTSPRKETFTWVKKLARSYLNKEGYEKPDPKPMEPPLGYNRTPSMMETMRAQIVAELARRAQLEEGAESADEADDFYVEDDPFPASPHEQDIDPPMDPRAQPADPYAELSAAVAAGVRQATFQEEEPSLPQHPTEPEGGGQGGGPRPSGPPESPPPPTPARRLFRRT